MEPAGLVSGIGRNPDYLIQRRKRGYRCTSANGREIRMVEP
jgi:hypothetical protein